MREAGVLVLELALPAAGRRSEVVRCMPEPGGTVRRVVVGGPMMLEAAAAAALVEVDDWEDARVEARVDTRAWLSTLDVESAPDAPSSCDALRSFPPHCGNRLRRFCDWVEGRPDDAGPGRREGERFSGEADRELAGSVGGSCSWS
jgi:hypothetical protein